MKITRRTKLLIVALALCLTTMIGSTFAWFTDSAESAVNTITAGNLDMKVSYKPYGASEDEWNEVTKETKIFADDALYEPGYTEAVWLKIENEGNLAFRYQTALNILLETQGTNKAGQQFSLSDYLVVKSANVTDVEGWEKFYTTRASLDNFAFNEIALNSKNVVITPNGVAYPEGNDNSTSYVLVVLQMPTTVGNEANHNGKNIPKIMLGLNVNATQLPYEADSFGTDYDAEAEYPGTVMVSTVQDLKDAMLIRGAKIILNDNLVIDKDTPLKWNAYMFVANGREVTIDLNGKNITVQDNSSLQQKGLFTTANGGTLNIVGEGTVEIKNAKSGIFHAMNKNDQINVYGGTYISNTDNGSNSLAIMYTNSGTIDVYDGKFASPEGVECANAEDIQGNRRCIEFHEGALLKHDKFFDGSDNSSGRIILEEGCTLQEVTIDGETWYKVVKQ